MEREARKATKRENRKANTKSLQKFLQNDDKEADSSSKHKSTSLPPPLTHSTVDHKLEPTKADDHDAELVLLDGMCLVDPVTSGPLANAEGAIPHTTCRDSSSNELHSEQSPILEPDKATETDDIEAVRSLGGSVASEYASSGPLPDLKIATSEPGKMAASEPGKMAASKPGKMAVSEPGQEQTSAEQSTATLACSDSQDGATQNDRENDRENDSEIGGGVTGEARLNVAAEVEHVQSEMDAKPMQFEADSLLKLLERFCATEYLTRDNKFACTQCTKTLAEEEEERRNTPGSGGEEERADASRYCSDKGIDEADDDGCSVPGSSEGESSGEEQCSDEEGEVLHTDRGSTSDKSAVESG